MTSTTRFFVLFLAVVFIPGALRSETPEVRKAIYDEKADARVEIASAIASAKKNNKRVLLVYGGNWCGWCHKLHDVFSKDAAIRKILLYEYNVVFVDIGRFDKHMDIVQRYGADIKKAGVPFLTVLAGDGKLLANQDTGSLEAGDQHDRGKVRQFLQKWVAPPVDAEKTLRDSLARATKEKKRVLVHLGAPW